MENHYPIPIYYTYQDFESNYNSDFEQWLDLYPDGRESDFIAEVERKHSFFFIDIYGRVSFMHYVIIHCYDNTKYLYSKKLEMEDFVSVLNFRIKDFIKNDPKTIINNISELSKIEDYILGKNKVDEYDIEYDDFNKYKEFIEVQNNGNEFDLVFNFVKFRNFELSLNRIFDELERKKTFLEASYISSENNIDGLNWQGSELQLTELIKALIENNSLNPNLTDKEIFRRFRLFFNVGDFNHTQKLQDIKKRTKDLTPFVNALEISLSNWVKKDNN